MGFGFSDVLVPGSSSVIDSMRSDSGGGLPPVPKKPLPKDPERRAVKQQQYANLAAYYTRLGRPIPDRIARMAGEADASIDFGGDFDLSAAGGLRGIASQGKPSLIRPGVFNNKMNQVRKENVFNAEQDAWKNEYEPRFDEAIGSAEQMLREPTVSASEQSLAQGRIASIIKGDKEKALRSTAATFGMRGLSPSNPAGAAVMARLSLEADTELSRTLGQYGMDVSDINRRGQERSIGLLTDLTSRKLAMENNIHNPDALIDLNREVSSLLEALRVDKERKQFEAALARDAGSRDWLGMGLDLATTIGGQIMGSGGGTSFGGTQAKSTGVGNPTMDGSYSPTGRWAGVSSTQSPASNFSAPMWF